MSDIVAIISNNPLNLPQEKLAALQVGFRNKTISYLSPDKETGCFLLYVSGSSFEDIAVKTSYPLDSILLTAMYYKWADKAAYIGMQDPDKAVSELQKDLLHTLLVATTVSVKKQLGDIIAGRADPKTCQLIPKNPLALRQLIEMLNGINDKGEATGNTIVQATNVQINNNEMSKLDRLKLLKDGKK